MLKPTIPQGAGAFTNFLEGGALIGSVLSIVETQAPRTLATAGLGTTIGAILLPFGAFLLGTRVAQEGEARERAIKDFQNKVIASAVSDAVKQAAAKLPGRVPKLNAKGRGAAEAIVQLWTAKIKAKSFALLLRDMQFRSHDEEMWQAEYENWVKEMAQEFYKVYADNKNVESTGYDDLPRARM